MSVVKNIKHKQIPVSSFLSVEFCLAVECILGALIKGRDVTELVVVAVVTAFLLSNLEKTGLRVRGLFVTGVWFLTEFETLLFFTASSDSESDSEPRFVASFSDTVRRCFSLSSDSSPVVSSDDSDSSESVSTLLDEFLSSGVSCSDSFIKGFLGAWAPIRSARALRSCVTSVFDNPASLIRVIDRLLKMI